MKIITPGNLNVRTTRRPAFTLIELLVVISIIAILIALLLPAVQQAREAVRRTQCKNHLKQIGLALHNYQSSHSVFPPGVLGSSGSRRNGDLLHTWMVQILPEMEQTPLYDSYDFNRRFDDALNRVAVFHTLPSFRCPSQTSDEIIDNRYGPNHYAGNAGTTPGTNDGILYPLSASRFRDITDGTSTTLAAGELAFEFGGWARGAMNSGGGGSGGGGGGGQGFSRGVLRWWKATPDCARPGMNLSPTSCSNNVEQRFQFSSPHTGGCHFAPCDGSARFLNENMSVNIFRAICTRRGREVVGEF